MIRTDPNPRPALRAASLARCCWAPALLAAGALFPAPAAWAGTTLNPVTIVDHGSFVTDTVNHRDWYKFSNADTTIGLSYAAAANHFNPLGWGTSSLAQVQSLQAQFGWLADTPTFSLNANYALTAAMGGYLGTTGTFFTDEANGTREDVGIDAVTSDLSLFFENNVLLSKLSVSTSHYQGFTDLHQQQFFFGDFVEGTHAFQTATAVEPYVGVWLSRESTAPVPEPGTWALFGLGIGFLGLFMRRRQQA